MTPEYFEKYILEPTHRDLLELCRTKGVEYAGTEDKLANFKKTAVECGLDPMQVLYIFMNKHYNAIQSYIRNKKVFSEPIVGRIRDCQLYLALLEGLVLEENEKLDIARAGKLEELFPYQIINRGVLRTINLTDTEIRTFNNTGELSNEALVRNQLVGL